MLAQRSCWYALDDAGSLGIMQICWLPSNLETNYLSACLVDIVICRIEPNQGLVLYGHHTYLQGRGKILWS
jgi:hypothetical protein